MKGQDLLLLFKMTSLRVQQEIQATDSSGSLQFRQAEHYREWGLFGSSSAHPESNGALDKTEKGSGGSQGTDWAESYSLRALSSSLGLSKSEVSNAIVRCREAGLLMNDFETSLPMVNRRALLGIAEHALKYFFPVKLGAIVRGIPTGFSAPALSKQLRSGGELIAVWSDPLGKQKGQGIKPLYKSVPDAVKKDNMLYHYLALVDAIRVGGPRETEVAVNLLKAGMHL